MGCFLTCFGTLKHKKRHHLVVDTSPSKDHRNEAIDALQVTEPTKQESIENKPINPITESKEKLEEPLIYTTKKKVTFDLNVKTYEEVSTEEVTDILVKSNVEKESEKEEETQCISNSIASNLVSYPPNHRYQNCENRDDDFADLDLEEGDLDDDNYDSECDCNNEGGDDQILVQEESSESLFSLSIESRKQGWEVELGEKEVNSPMPKCVSTNEEVNSIGSNRDRSQYVHSVLNPVENLTQWKAVKAKATPPLKSQAKENINIEQDFDTPISLEPSFKLSTHSSKMNSKNKKLVDQEIAVDTSLSSWLVESETTPMSKASNNSVGNSPAKSANSPRNLEDRPILGVLTIEELKQHAVPTRSRSRSPDETPIIGTVGSYWSHTGQVVDSDSSSPTKGMTKIRSKNKEDERVNWNSTPFEARLERALERGTVEV